jgi:hypothetical protein
MKASFCTPQLQYNQKKYRVSLDIQGKATSPRPRVVITGAGFGGLAARKLPSRQSVNVTLFDKRSYHLFQPLLY